MNGSVADLPLKWESQKRRRLGRIDVAQATKGGNSCLQCEVIYDIRLGNNSHNETEGLYTRISGCVTARKY